jgi:hypothetical protein
MLACVISQIITINRNLTERRIKRLVLEVDSALKFYSPEKSRSKQDRNDSGDLEKLVRDSNVMAMSARRQ